MNLKTIVDLSPTQIEIIKIFWGKKGTRMSFAEMKGNFSSLEHTAIKYLKAAGILEVYYDHTQKPSMGYYKLHNDICRLIKVFGKISGVVSGDDEDLRERIMAFMGSKETDPLLKQWSDKPLFSQ